MQKLSEYDNTTVRLVCQWGDVFTGACVWDDAEYNLHEYNVEEESLKIGEYIIFESQIREIELLRREVCIPVRDWPEAREEIVAWFQERWEVPPETCRESVVDCIGTEGGLPQWYVVVRGSRIIAGCGVIESALPDRKEPTPRLCALHVDEEYRHQGIGGFLLQYVCEDMAALGEDTLLLQTELTGFFEKYGWRLLRTIPGEDGALLRLYVHHAERD